MTTINNTFDNAISSAAVRGKGRAAADGPDHAVGRNDGGTAARPGARPDKPPVAMLWDGGHIWALMSLRALLSLGFPVRLVKGQDIAQGALFRKQDGGDPCRLLVVPGGSASIKAEALGEAGMENVRAFLKAGGRYLGFCGGAGLALSTPRGLGLCPWKRAQYPQRFLHLISGYVLAEPCPHDLTPEWHARTPSLPVWWPGRFSNSGGDVEVLARYRGPDNDFWISDIALDTVPGHVFEEWKERYGVNLTADFLRDTEIMVTGSCGEGRYVLSYSHLETPDSPDANAWFAHILARLTGTRVDVTLVPSWHFLFKRSPFASSVPKSLRYIAGQARDLLDLATEHRLFFARTPWLMGWRTGLPGGVCNNLLAAAVSACAVAPTGEGLAFWKEHEQEASSLADEFMAGAEGYLLAARLADTLRASLPNSMDAESLARDRDHLFGHPMAGQGLLGRLLALVEEYFYICSVTGDRVSR